MKNHKNAGLAALAIVIAVVSFASVRLAAQSPQERQEQNRKLIREVADALKKKAAATAEAGPASRNWKPARTPWGDVDISGVYTNSDEAGIPFERPAEFEGRRLEDITGVELTKLQQVRREATIENAVRQSDQPNPQLFWWETLNAQNSRAWLVVDPPDGKIPPQTPEGQQRAAAAPTRDDSAAAAPPIRTRTAACTTSASRAACRAR